LAAAAPHADPGATHPWNQDACTEEEEEEAEAISLVFAAKSCLRNVEQGGGGGEGGAADGVARALDLAREALRLSHGRASCGATARAHEIAAVCILKLAHCDSAARHSPPPPDADPEAAESEAASVLGFLAGLPRSAGAARALGAAGPDALEDKSMRVALEHVRQARQVEPMDVRLLEREALVLACLGQVDHAHDSLVSAHAQAWGLSAAGLGLLALLRYVTAGPDAALELTEALQARHPGEAWVLMLHGRVQLSRHEHHAALSAFFRVICACSGGGAAAGMVRGRRSSVAEGSVAGGRADWAADAWPCREGAVPDTASVSAAGAVAGLWQGLDVTSGDALATVILLSGQGAADRAAGRGPRPHLKTPALLPLNNAGGVVDGGGQDVDAPASRQASHAAAAAQRIASAAWLACADVYLAAGLLQHARTAVALARRNSSAPSADVEFYEGRLCEAADAPLEAIACYSKALAIRHHHPPSLIRKAALVLGRVRSAAGRPGAVAVGEDARSSRAAAAHAMRLLRRIGHKGSDLQQGACSEAWKLMATALQMAGKDAAALQAMQVAVATQAVREPPVPFTSLPLPL